jgi:hypothetical protein
MDRMELGRIAYDALRDTLPDVMRRDWADNEPETREGFARAAEAVAQAVGVAPPPAPQAYPMWFDSRITGAPIIVANEEEHAYHATLEPPVPESHH